LQHNCRTYGGRLRATGMPALVSDCCVEQLDWIVRSGLYSRRQYNEFLDDIRPTGKAHSNEEIEAAITAAQTHIAFVDDLNRRAGLKKPARVHRGDKPWSMDDAAWFKANPTRAHRLRPTFPGEVEIPPAPPHHSIQVLVRQVQPGYRVRQFFYRDLRTPIPDIEEIIHAMFDLNEKSGGEGKPIKVKEVVSASKKYLAMKGGDHA
jgi:hypothetical protein